MAKTIKSKGKNQFIFLNLLGVFFLALGISAILNSLYIKNPMQVFWMCYISLTLIGIGIIKRNSFLIMSQVYILAIPMLVWDIDFLYYLLTGNPLWGITDYFFLERSLNLGKIISLQHLFTVPVSLYATYLIGLKRTDAWKLSFIQALLVFIAVSLFTLKEANINCVFDPCLNVLIGLPYIPYRVVWFFVFFTLITISAAIINTFLFMRRKNS